MIANCLMLAAGQFALVTSVFMLTGILPEIATDFGVGIGRMGYAIAAFSLTYAIASPLLAVATSRFGARVILITCLLVFAAANVAATLVTDFTFLLIARVVAAAADGLYAATACALVAQSAPPERKGFMLALVNLGVTLAFLVGVPLTTYLAELFRWPGPFFFVAALAAVTALALAIRLPHSSNPNVASLRERLLIFSVPKMLPTLLVTVVSYVGLFTVYNFIAPLLLQTLPPHEYSLARLLFTFGLATILGNVAGGLAADRWGANVIVIVSLAVLAAVLFAADLFTGAVPTAYALMFILGFAHYMALTPLQYRIAQLGRDNAAIALALNGSSTYVGVALAAVVGGAVIERQGVENLGMVGGSFKLIGIVIFLWSLWPLAAFARRRSPA